MNLWNRRKAAVIFVLMVLIVGTTLYWEETPRQNKAPLDPEAVMTKQREQKALPSLRVYVSGAVMYPGLYDLAPGLRYADAIRKAGGMTDEADETRVNLAKKIKDGCQVNVPLRKNRRPAAGKAPPSAGDLPAREKEKRKDKGAAGVLRINLNDASQEELEHLPGIGPGMAQRIISERNKAPFQSVDELLRVKGIGPKNLSRFRELVEVIP